MVSDRLPQARIQFASVMRAVKQEALPQFVLFPTTNVQNYLKQTDAQTLISILTEKRSVYQMLIKLRQNTECQSFVLFTQAVQQLMKKKSDMLPKIIWTFLN